MQKNSFRNLILITLLTSTTASVLIVASASAATLKPKAPKPACRIELDNAHISTTLLEKRQHRYVKVNAWSVCNIPQVRVTLTLEIYKTKLFGNELIEQFETEEFLPKSSGLKVAIKDAAIECKNRRVTRYFGIVYAKAFIGGKWQYAGRT